MDKEKLSAARKKLKQYQLFKKDNISRHQAPESLNDESAKNNNGATKQHSTKYESINIETESNEDSLISCEKDAEKINSAPFNFANVNNIKDEIHQFESTSNNSDVTSTNDFMYNTNNDVDNFHSDQFIMIRENALPSQSSNSCKEGEFCESNDSHAVTHIDSNASLNHIDNEDKNPSDNFYDSSLQQKENLLQMASSVAQLIDDNEFNKTITMNNLMDKNQFLTNCLQEQTNLIGELHGQVSRYSSKISELEAIIAANQAECTGKIIQEVNPLKQQVELHTHTTGILVAEKAELKATVDQCYATIREKTEMIENLSKQLESRQLELIEYEKEAISYKNTNEELKRKYQELEKSFEKLMDDCLNLRKDKESLELECSELRQKLNLSTTNLSSLQQELQEKNAMLSLNEIKIRQLITASDQVQGLENDRQTNLVYEQQLTQLKDTLSALNHEKEEANKQYKSYLEQSDERLKSVKIELNKCHKHIEELESREKDYIQRLSNMEQQLQIEREQVDSDKPLLEHKVEMLTKNIDNLVMEQESLQIALNQKDAEIEALNKELQELPEIKKHNIDASALAIALESEQLGASRAINQNQQLKHQLDEMHDAFVLLSNNKLDLTEQLQTERNLCKQLNTKLSEYESTLQHLKNQLQRRDVALTELKRENPQNVDLPSKTANYNSESNYLLQELQNAKKLIDNLQAENNLLKEELSLQDQQLSINNARNVESDVNSQTNAANLNEIDQSEITDADTHETKNCVIPEFIEKLEGRFKETMDKVAELTDEKQKLEHLVLQLQEETETIGEYVTLYQKQRSILQGRAKERELYFKKISEERDYQQKQFHNLKYLVSKLLKTNPTAFKDVFEANESPQSSDCYTKENLEKLFHLDENLSDTVKPTSNLKDNVESSIVDHSGIKDCSGTCILEPNFHPCPTCSGKLITI